MPDEMAGSVWCQPVHRIAPGDDHILPHGQVRFPSSRKNSACLSGKSLFRRVHQGIVVLISRHNRNLPLVTRLYHAGEVLESAV